MLKTKYLEKVLDQIPRLLSYLDKDTKSVNYGCFDRLYWGWKVVDFPDATLQRGVYPLALLYSNDFEKNVYFKNDNLKKWIEAGLLYWCKIQHNNGSFDQAFPYEQSYGAAAFTLYPQLKVFEVIYDSLSNKQRDNIKKHLKRTSEFLTSFNEEHGIISNHLASAAIALLESNEILEKEYKPKAMDLLATILKNQSPDGYFLEYEGADPGYQTLATYYLALCYKKTKKPDLLNALKKSIEFLSYFIHPDGSIGGEYGSRNTEVFYPAGFELLKNEIPLAKTISDRMYESICKNNTVTLNSMDTGNLIPLMTNYLIAYLESKKPTEDNNLKLPCELDNVNKYFEDSKILVKGTSKYYSIVGGTKGGVTKIFDKVNKKLIWDDCGYIGEIADGTYISTQMYNKDVKTILKDNVFQIETNFFKVLRQTPTPFKFVILRILNLTLLRNIALGNIAKKMLVKMFMTGKKKYPVKLHRTITYYEDKIEIEDVLTKKSRIKFKWLEYGKKFSTIHMASSKYFQKNQLSDKVEPNKIDLEAFNKNNEAKVKTIIDLEG